MKAAVFYDREDIRYEERPIPQIGENEVLLKMKVCGVCGTDIHKVVDRTVPPNTVLGHEVAGEIVQVGKNVTQFEEGDRVFVAHHVPCFTCHYCNRGNYSLCTQFKATNLDPGGFSEYIRVSAVHVKHTMGKLPSAMSFETGAFVEPVACCLHGFESIALNPGDTVFIMGAGQIGCIQIQLAKYFLADRVIVSDINPFRLNKSLEFGADYIINSKNEHVRDRIMEITDGQGADVVIISAGVNHLLTEAMECVGKGGTILVFAPFKRDLVPLRADRFFQDEIKLVGSYSSNPYNYDKALQLLKMGIVEADKMITHRFHLSQLNEAIQCAHSTKENVLKVLIKS
ncbi:MAG: L-iditol 2-dehydrogenase [Bacillaceae bacterium]|nr:MAG: L-iditol 2-dehydrogenase [Bacillaceae bacterium]